MPTATTYAGGQSSLVGCRGERHGSPEGRDRLKNSRSMAKIGMTLSLGALIATGLMRGRGARILHVWSGVALVGFSFWHHRLYLPANRKSD